MEGSLKLVFLAVAAAAAIAVQSGVEAAPTRQEKPDTKILELCLTGGPDDRSLSDIVAEPIKALFVDGVTMMVDEVLCAARPREENDPGRGWFRLDPGTPPKVEYLGPGFGEGEVTRFAPSPDGKYLAVEYSAEGHPSIEIVDLPALMQSRQYKSLSLVGTYPGVISIDRWETGGALLVKSDMLVHIPASSRAELFALETFSWDFQSGKLKPLSDALNDPVRYFAEGLRDPDQSTRLTALAGLQYLDDQSAVPFLRQALTVEGDETIRQETRDLLRDLARTAELINVCMSSNPEMRARSNIVSETIRDQTICVIPTENRLHHQTWYRIDRSAGPFNVVLLAGGGDGLTRLAASTSGTLLAAQFAGVGSSWIDIVDMASLMRTNDYQKVAAIHGLGGSVAIEQWRNDDLQVTSDVFLNRDTVPEKADGDPIHLPLLSPETFEWRSQAATIVPPTGELQDPVQYYCAGLGAARSDRQRIALRGLALLKDPSSVPCLELAMSTDTNGDIHKEIRQTLVTIAGK